MEKLCHGSENISRTVKIEFRDNRLVLGVVFKVFARDQPRVFWGVKKINGVVGVVVKVPDVLMGVLVDVAEVDNEFVVGSLLLNRMCNFYPSILLVD
jgi:hypothetical protein